MPYDNPPVADTPPAATRRCFITTAPAVSGGLLVGVMFLTPAGAGIRVTATTVTAWVSIASDESVTILIGAADIGQGVIDSLPAVLADELKVDRAQVRTARAPAGPAYLDAAGGVRLTGATLSLRDHVSALLTVGATARVMLIEAAARRLGVPPHACRAAHGMVSAGRRAISYGSVTADAALLTPPANPPLLSRSRTAAPMVRARELKVRGVVGATGIEPVTPAV